ncbi:MAG: NADH-quinone oxidoreductase subunit C [Gammaproteobacteria bacterium]|nr:NADH-quinone oxidoreductase subunit C [Gammaproteobacteria bacterium]
MTPRLEALAARLGTRFGSQLRIRPSRVGEVDCEVDPGQLLEVARALRDEEGFRFEMLVDLCGVDYLGCGEGEWNSTSATRQGYSRAADLREVIVPDPDQAFEPRRFAVVYHLLSVSLNQRMRLRVYTGAGNPPVVPSVIGIWRSADWYEREAFDLFGILFDGHPDLRRLLTDYGFIGHPFRKDFPTSGNVEVRYDADKGRVVYEPVSIEPRVLVPRIMRDDNRYMADLKDKPDNA